MKPIAIMRHAPTEGPGYFATYLERHGIPWRVIKVDAGEPVPDDPRAFSGIAFMGGPMSVNDDLPWLALALALIRSAVAVNVPLVGHCLGGQLMAKAMGGVVARNRVKEIGWGRVDVVRDPAAQHWFGVSLASFESFHWHGETFTVPPSAARIASSAYCENQVFVLGPHLAMQCHVEMTPALIRSWCRDWGKEVRALAARTPSVQTPAEMMESIEARVQALNVVADRLYDRWIEGLSRN